MPTREEVLAELSKVKGPDLQGDIVSLGLVSDVFISDGRVIFSITVPAEQAQELEPMRQAAEKVVGKLPGVDKVLAALTSERQGGAGAKAPPPVRPAPAAADLSFRGALIIDKNRGRTIADLAALSGTKAQRQGDGWILTR